ncbi:MAG: hypothetical protein H6707_18905 [Deltaproteobacteria bacterium]|nr:hypothetical protein [Deltaproteobacteria bacterium]
MTSIALTTGLATANAANPRPQLNLHSATREQLAALPQMTRQLASDLLRHRSFLGQRLNSIDALIEGPKHQGVLPKNVVDAIRPYLTLTPAGQPIQRRYFVQSIESVYSSGRGKVDFRLTEANIDHPKLKRRLKAGTIAKQRWLTIENPVIAGGYGSGHFDFMGKRFAITYAWRGINDGFTIRTEVVGKKPWNSVLLKTMRQALVRAEHGGKLEQTVEIPRSQYLLAHYGVADNKLSTLRRQVIKSRAQLRKRAEGLLASLTEREHKRWSAQLAKATGAGFGQATPITDQAYADSVAKGYKHKRTVSETLRFAFEEIKPGEFK